MSFSGTPLGQGRRLDHHTFLGKPPSSTNYPPTSYAYGAPLGSRSPPKPTSPSRPRNGQQALEDGQGDDQETTLQRFAKIKQRESAGDYFRVGGTRTQVPSVDPTKLPPDTSVNTANALFQAANSGMSTYNNPHNNSWASSSREKGHVPRSTSQEYENTINTLGNQSHKRLAAPPDKLGRAPTSTTIRKPPSKSTSSLHVPDSEGEGDSRVLNGRAKSPLEASLTFAKNALGAAAFYVRQRSREPENRSVEHPPANGNTNGNDSSYDYAEEEQSYQTQKRINAAHKRNRMSVDNKAYKPSLSEEEESEYSDDDKTRRRRKKTKKGPAGGPLTSLPVVGSDKRRRRKGHGTKGNLGGPDEYDSDSDDNGPIDVQSTQLQSSGARTSNPPLSRTSDSRFSLDPPRHGQDDSLSSANQGLDSIPEIDESALPAISEPQIRQPSQRRRSRSRTPAPHAPARSFSIGGLLGSLVHIIFKLSHWTLSRLLSLLSMFTFLFGQVFGTTFDIILRRPAGWARSVGPTFKYALPSLVLLLAWYAMQSSFLGSYIPSLSFPSRTPVYQAPVAPPADISELAQRLLAIETALSGLSADSERTKAKTDDGVKVYSDLLGRVNYVEGRLFEEAKKLKDVEIKARESVSKTITNVKQDVELLQSQLIAQQRQYEKDQKAPAAVTDEDARIQLRLLEERLGGVEGGVREALELGKKAAAVVPAPAAAPLSGAAWWNKVAGSGSKSVLQIKSADGQDVSALISHMVDAAVSLSTKDGGVAKPDYALHSGGARVIPSLTSERLEISPRGVVNQLKSLVTGFAGYETLPPIVALHPDLYSGHCYPFAGVTGQLGIHLAAPIYVEEVTIDHIAKELAYDLRSAPRDMEVWGLLEGQDNTEKVAAWRAERAERRKEAGLPEEEALVYPPTLPIRPEYIRLVNFTYDVHSSKNVQTFLVDPDIRDLGIDFGIVVLRVLNNWGQEHFTCLYRFRVHGQRMGEIPGPLVLDESASSLPGSSS
ncbi:hypothetical protein CPB84DRAFT_1743479 [Gymnopilus junonius]|uniref:SUN domain-containing protein n=1 Tax=Gymnopilus junonius TaxID=109634 RepID=A0A9P5TTF5_GYMJU|nr:hypothetical protein CPB84DRAFT_1743479 [Gymnopilus junonius]